jgi:hypothetical protein
MTSTVIPNSNQPAINDLDLFTPPWFIYLQGIFKAIRGKFQLNLSGILSVNTNPVSNSGSIETDLITYTLPANTLQNNGDSLNIKAWGSFAANTNNKTLILQFGSQVIFDTGTLAINSGDWEIEATIIRKSPTTQEISTKIISSNSLIPASVTRTIGIQDLTTALIIKCTGQGSATNDLTEYSLMIGLTPYD